MTTPVSTTLPHVLRRLGFFTLSILAIGVLLVIGYTALMLNWSYSTGERAGFLQKISHKGFVCKTWEGELSLVSMPGTTPEKFLFTVRDEAVAKLVNDSVGKRVTLSYAQHIGLPSTCFGETQYFVTALKAEAL